MTLRQGLHTLDPNARGAPRPARERVTRPAAVLRSRPMNENISHSPVLLIPRIRAEELEQRLIELREAADRGDFKNVGCSYTWQSSRSGTKRHRSVATGPNAKPTCATSGDHRAPEHVQRPALGIDGRYGEIVRT